MIVDSSALIAILRDETEAEHFTRLIVGDRHSSVSAGSLLEASVVADGSRNPRISREFDRLVDDLELEVEPVTATQARIAREAYRDFGKGSGHPAGLSLGDCFAYALAKDRNETLLYKYKGDDFAHTDVRSAL